MNPYLAAEAGQGPTEPLKRRPTPNCPRRSAPGVSTRPARRRRPVESVLLTGATGFLGAFLLRELLDRPGVVAHCLVRAKNEDEARQRVLAGMDRYGIRRAEDEHRMRPICGDLALPSLGLSSDQFVRIVDELDCIIHNGAHVHAALPYEKLRATNVGGTREILRLASPRDGLPVHVVSTLSVFDGAEGDNVFTEALWPTEPRASGTGYAQSKIVAEWLVREAQRRGMPVALYRPSAVIGDTRTGACQSGVIISLLIALCVGPLRRHRRHPGDGPSA